MPRVYIPTPEEWIKLRLITVFGLYLIAALAVGAFNSTYASASMTLPEAITKTSGVGSGGTTVFKTSGVEIKCERGTESGTALSKKTGTWTKDITGCSDELTDSNCHSLGDGTGVILATGEATLVLTTIGGVDHHLTWLLVKEFGLECGTVFITTKGGALAEVTPVNVATKQFETHLHAPSGRQEFTTFENDSGELVSVTLLVAAALGFHTGTVESAEDRGETLLLTELIN
jgi:hypothetical protein